MRLHAVEWGSADSPPLVMLHGVAGHGMRFRRLAEDALAARFRCVAPDLRGHGASVREPPWHLEQHVEDVLDTLEALGVAGPCVFIGHSFGGRMVLEVGAVRPEAVRAAVLLDPAIQLPPGVGLDMADGERAKPESFGSVDEAIAWRAESGRLLSAPRELLEEDMDQHLEPGSDGRWRFRYSRSAVVAMYGELCRAHPPFEGLRVPTLLVLAATGSATMPFLVDPYREALGDLLEVVTLESGHNLLWDDYPETRDAVAAFLDRTAP
ncbi:MAG: alpha/beta hydrolase [Actinobacteria bacterium]|nr:alpha/beta hydrolase [Actinomycetota bacterium]